MFCRSASSVSKVGVEKIDQSYGSGAIRFYIWLGKRKKITTILTCVRTEIKCSNEVTTIVV